MDTEAPREEVIDAEDGLRRLIVDLEDLVDWTVEAAKPPEPPTIEQRAQRGKQWIVLGVVGLLVGTVAVAAWARRER
jgi:hypothetical protein